MSSIETLFFFSLAAFVAIGLLVMCYRIDQLTKENEYLKRNQK